MRRAIALFLLILLAASAHAVTQQDSLKVFAVTDSGGALSADLVLEIKPGSGRVWSSTDPLVGTSTQTTEKLAVQVARDYSNVVDSYDYFFDINSNASIVEGPSAGAAMTLLTISMLKDKVVPDNVALTGTISASGAVGGVGGIFEKSKEAARTGIELFMIPEGEAKQTVRLGKGVQSINLLSYAPEEWGLKVVEVTSIDEVLHYAFLDPDEIDVNAPGEVLPDFVPQPITFGKHLEPMHFLIKSYIEEGEESVARARGALSGTLLNDPALIDALLRHLNDSEKTLGKAKILFDQNYLYSAGNYAFLAIVSSNFVRDAAESPELLAAGSTAISSRARELERKIGSLAIDLNRFVTIDAFEWHVAAKQRLAWAKQKVEPLKESGEIVITINGSSIDEAKLNNLLDYEYAVAWHAIAEDFFELTKGSERAIYPDGHFLNVVNSYIANAEKSLPLVDEAEREDIERRLEAARLQRELGWYHAAMFDSASSLGLINAQIFIKNKELAELRAALEEKIGALEAKLRQSKEGLVWARLYLDHSRYFLESSDFYLAQGQDARALENVKSGLSLLFMAESLEEAASKSYSYFETLPESRFVEGKLFPQQFPPELLSFIVLVAAVAAILSALSLFYALRGRMPRLGPVSVESEIRNALRMQRKLRQGLEAGRIEKAEFERLNKVYSQQIAELRSERRQLSRSYVELDLSKSKLLAFERALGRLRKEFKKGNLTERDFQEAMRSCSSRIDALKRTIGSEMQALSAGKSAVESSAVKAKALEREAKSNKKRRPQGKKP